MTESATPSVEDEPYVDPLDDDKLLDEIVKYNTEGLSNERRTEEAG